MSYVVLARKYRPTRFDEVVGQPHVVKTILNGLLQKRLAHAYLLCGPRGVGKTTTARLLARAINCTNSSAGEPCGACNSCTAINEGRGLDVIEIDAASNNGVDDVRGINDNVRYAPIEGVAKVWIIDEVHMLSTAAFNALLKTLEEPPAHAHFLLATTAPQKLPSTILSRCQRFDFRRVSASELVQHLESILKKENIPFQREALDIIARKADGSVRDSLSLLDQVIAFAGGQVMRQDAVDVVGDIRLDLYFRALALIQTSSLADSFRLDDELASTGTDPQDYLVGLQEHLVNLMQVKALGVEKADVPIEFKQQFADSSVLFEDGDLVRLLQLCSIAEVDVRRNYNPRTRLQLLLTKFATFERSVVISDLIASLGQPAQAAPAARPAPTPASAPLPRQTFSRPAQASRPVAPVASPQPPASHPLPPPSISDGDLLLRAVAIWPEVCDELSRDNNHRSRMIRYGGIPASASNGVLRINFQTQNHLDMARALLAPLKQAFASRIGSISIELQIGPVNTVSDEPEELDEANKLLTDRWGARPA